MRTNEKFNHTWKQLKHYHNLHKKSVWLVPTENDYIISIVKPCPEDLPIGTASNLYDVDDNILETVKSNKTPF